jgi:4-amino-4-deoxy-L-arabinose transferase-like glycosyltransferase
MIVLIVAITALLAPPNTWDAMEYHLPRLMMWMGNHSVRFYPTPDYCQLIYGPWSEYAMMHTYLLSGGDRFVNLIQLLSLIGCAISVSAIAQRLGAGRRGQVLAAIASVTIPEGLLEASGPMNTYVASLWIAITVLFLMDWHGDSSWLNTACVGLGAGLAILTKGTAYVFLPFLVMACWMTAPRPAKLQFLKRSAVLVLLILALNGAHYLRCYDLSGSPLGVPLPEPYPRAQLTMGHVTVQGTAANLLRNVSLHLGSPSAAMNSRTEAVVRRLIRALGADPDDPNAVWLGMPFEVHGFSLHEIHAGNPLQLLLFFAATLIVYLRWKEKSLTMARWYGAGILAGFVFFAAMIQWQTWAARYHLPLFVLAAAMIGLVLERCVARRIATVAAIVMIVYAIPFAAVNRTHSLIRWHRVDDIYRPRAVLYFSDQHENIAANYAAIADSVNRSECRNVAINSYIEDPQIKLSPPSLYVYPLLALLHADGVTRTVWYTGVQNLTSRYSSEVSHPEPCAVICLDCAKVPAKWAEYQASGSHASVFDQNVVFTSASVVMKQAAGSRVQN